VLVDAGKIVKIGRQSEFDAHNERTKIDCHGGVLLPGLVDAHSHPVFAGDRVNEFAMKLAGATYMDVR
jgi:imidazolonepropionase